MDKKHNLSLTLFTVASSPLPYAEKLKKVREIGYQSIQGGLQPGMTNAEHKALLDSLGILYSRVDHAHADTIEACHAVEEVLGWPVCKNLFLCNRQKTQYYLLMMEGDKVFKTKDLSKQLGVSRLSFAGPEDMVELLALLRADGEQEE